MEKTFLPGDVRQRLTDLMKDQKVTQTELARKIGCGDSVLSCFISGQTDKLSNENIIRIARVFNVSTDFLLGITNVPDRKNYAIDELGLSAEAARNLFTEKVNTAVLNRLLESPRFAELTYTLEQYFNDTIAAGFAAQNQMYATLSALTRKTVKSKSGEKTAKDISRLRTSPYQADLATIENQFMLAVKEIKKEIGHDFSVQQAFTKEIAQQMFTELTKGQDMENPHITPEQITEAVLDSVSCMEGASSDVLEKFGQALTDLIYGIAQGAKQENKNEDPEQ